MSIIFILLTISLLVASIFLGVFLWNLKTGQYEDSYTPSVRILFEDAPKAIEPLKKECQATCATCKCLSSENHPKKINENSLYA